MDGSAGHVPEPITPELLADLQAGLHDDATARVGDALQAAPPHRGPACEPAHSVRHTPRWQLIGLVAGVGAAVVGVVLGGVMLVRGPAPTRSAGPAAESITVSRPAGDLPLSDPQIVGLLSHSPDYGPLADPQRRASCLSGLGYSAATPVLGARPVDIQGRPAVLMVLAADTPRTLLALVVEPDCNSAHTGLLANTLVTRP
jgi:hypothetical protein